MLPRPSRRCAAKPRERDTGAYYIYACRHRRHLRTSAPPHLLASSPLHLSSASPAHLSSASARIFLASPVVSLQQEKHELDDTWFPLTKLVEDIEARNLHAEAVTDDASP